MATRKKAVKRKASNKQGADSGGDIQRANRERREYRADDFVSLYANDTQIQLSPWDFRLIFGQIEPPDNDSVEQPMGIREIGEVRMSPQHAKMVALVLRNQIQVYEKNIGEIYTLSPPTVR